MRRESTTIQGALSEPSKLAHVRRQLGLKRTQSRWHLAASLCERYDFRDARGELQVSSCLKSLRDFERRGEFKLPPKQLDLVDSWRPRRLPKAVPAPQGVPDAVSDIRGLRLVEVTGADDQAMRTWNELMAREHPQGKRRLVGRQVKYLVASDHGWLGAVGFSASALRLQARDRWIGWTDEQRRLHQDRVVNLSRLLIRPSVRCRNLASHVMGKSLRRLPEDFERRYGYRPWLLESFVDVERYEGTCFQAANWERIGQTKGRGRNDTKHSSSKSIKDIYVYPLVSDFRDRMGVPQDQGIYLRPSAVGDGLGAKDWARQEFGTVELGDKRLRERLIKIVEDRSRRPGGSYLDASGGDRKAAKGYYYFVDSGRETINPEAILATHRVRTTERCMAQKTVLVLQDTTDLNFASRHRTSGLGVIGSNQTGAKSLGLRLHSSIAVTPDGLPLGVLKSTCFAPEEKGKKGKQSVNRPIEEKKSFRWLQDHRTCVEIAKKTPDTHFLTVADREGDIFELFLDAEPTRHRVGVLVRAQYDRCLSDKKRKMFAEVKASKNRAQIEAVIPRQRWKKAKPTAKGKTPRLDQEGLPSRYAILTVQFEAVSIVSSRPDLRDKGPINLWCVYAREENPPAGTKQIEWMLLTTEKVETVDDAARMVGYYALRWRIEEWHRVLKSGIKILEHQHETAERLARVIAIDAVLAWRIQLMTLLGREVPDLPCTIFFDEWEVRLLEALEKRKGKRGFKPPFNLQTAIILVAMQGGYLNRPSDPPPGSKCIWRGIAHVVDMAIGYWVAYHEREP